MEIKITLDSAAIQERFDRGGMQEMLPVLNDELGFGIKDRTSLSKGLGEVYDQNGNVAGKWEIIRA